jgi:carboxylesterase 2
MIFGESAGGESVKQLLANPPSPVPFSSAILESEQGLIPGNGLLNFKKVLLNFKCLDIACLRKIPATEIKAYIEENSLGFPPVNDDRTSTNDVRPSILSGKWPKIPVMLGSNLNEARVFLAVAGLNDGSSALKYAFSQFNISSSVLQNSILGMYATAGITAGIDVADR